MLKQRHTSTWKPLFCLLMYLFMSNNSVAQGTDTMAMANRLRNDRDFSGAVNLLTTYYGNHPDNVNAIWMLAQTYYWMKDFKQAEYFYLEGLRLSPDNLHLELDYARMLLAYQEYDKINSILLKFLDYSPSNSEALLMLAKIQYWQGDFKAAKFTAEKLVRESPDFTDGVELLDEIRQVSSPWTRIGATFGKDDQRLQIRSDLQ